MNNFKELAGITQNVIVSVSAVATVVIAYFGLRRWRNELKGSSEFSKAVEILKALYKIERAFRIVRNPAIFQFEYPEEYISQSGHLKTEFQYEGTAKVYEERFTYLSKAFSEFEDLVLDGMVIWGQEFYDLGKPIRECKVELTICIQNHLRRMKGELIGSATETEKNDVDKSTLYFIGKDSPHDKFTPKIVSAISVFEEKLRPVVKS